MIISAVSAAPPSLIIDKRVNNPNPAPGDSVIFSIRYRCASVTDNCFDTTITDAVPNNFEIDGFTQAGGQVMTVSQAGQTITWELGTGSGLRQLDAGTIGVLKVFARVSACNDGSALSATSVTNQADISSFDETLSTNITASGSVSVNVPAIPQCVENTSNPPAGLSKGRQISDDVSINGHQRYNLQFPTHPSTYTITDNLPPEAIVWEITKPTGVSTLEVECNDSGTFRTIANGLLSSGSSSQLSGFAECASTPHPGASGHDVYNITAIRYTIPANASSGAGRIWVTFFDTNPFPPAQLTNWQEPIVGNEVINCLNAPALGSGDDGRACRVLRIHPAGPWGDPSKGIIGSPTTAYNGAVPLDPAANPPRTLGSSDIAFSLKLQTRPLGGAAWPNPVIVDLLDSNLEYVPYPSGSNWWQVSIPSNVASLLTDPACFNPAFTVIDNFNGTGRQLLRWDFTGCTIPGTQVDNELYPTWMNVEFTTRIKAGTPATTIIGNQAVTLFDASANLQANRCDAGGWPPANTDTLDLDGDGDFSEDICRTQNTNYTIEPISNMSSSKWVQGALDTKFSRFPFNGQTDLTGVGTYEMFIENTGNVDITIVDAVDILPHVGDTGVLPATGTRLSAWDLELAGGITVEKWDGASYSNAAGDLTIAPQYSTSLNPCRFENASTNNEDLTADQSIAVGPTSCTVNPWGAAAAGARSFSFRYAPAADTLGAGEHLRIIVPVRINGNPPGCDDPACAGDTVDTTAVAWNSFAFGGTYLDGAVPTKLLDSEPIKVGLQMVNPAATAGLGDYVWYDANGDGFQGITETPIEGVTVSLYEAGVKIKDTTTDSNGFYAFYGLTPSGSYTVALNTTYDFTSGALKGLSLTQQDAMPTDDTEDSDAAINAQGFPEISATAGSAGTNDMTYDFGFWEPASIGNRVWYDIDAAGDQGPTDIGVQNATVTLKQPGPDGLAGTGDDIIIGTQTTDSDGYYLFTNLPEGQYFLEFNFATITGNDPLTNSTVNPSEWTTTIANASGNSLTDSDVGSSGATVITYLSVGEEDLSWDAGLKPIPTPTNPVSLGNVVWEDTTPNDIQDPSEPGIPDVQVELYDAAGLPVDVTYTDSNGRYQFDNLEDGNTYSLRFVPPAGYTFVAQNAGADIIDSDVDPATGTTGDFVVSPAAALGDTDPDATATLDPRWDAGVRGTLSLGNLVWFDLDADGVAEGGEPVLSGLTVNLLDGTGNPFVPAQTTTTDANGRYLFTGLAPNSYIVEVQIPTGTSSTVTTANSSNPDNGDDNDNNGTDAAANPGFVRSNVVALNFGTGANAEADHGVAIDGITDSTLNRNADYTLDFGFIVRDFGDLIDDGGNNSNTGPDDYNTNDDAAATHAVWDSNGDNIPDLGNAVWLGAIVDGETDGQPNIDPNGTNGDGLDEDGVSFRNSGWIANTTASDLITVTVSTLNNAQADVGIWIDWDNDGGFDNFYELPNVSAGSYNVPNVTIPAGYTPFTQVRFRIRAFEAGTTLALGTGFNGAAVNGEVEDYSFAFAPTAVTLRQIDTMPTSVNLPVWAIALMLGLTLLTLSRQKRMTAQEQRIY